MAAFSVVTDCTTHRTYNISYLALCRKKVCWSLAPCFSANKAYWKPQSFNSHDKSLRYKRKKLMNVQGGPWGHGQEGREQIRLNVFTCQEMKGARAPKSQLFTHLVSPPSHHPQPQKHFLSRAWPSETCMVEAAAAKKMVFLSRPCFLFAGWGVWFAGVRFCRFWYRLSPLSHQNRDAWVLARMLPAIRPTCPRTARS